MTEDSEVKEGFKKTKIIWIPLGWTQMCLGEFLEFRNGVNADKESYGNGVKFINVMEVLNNRAILEEDIAGSVSISQSLIDLNSVLRGDILLNRTSETTNEIGMTSVYDDHKPVVFGGFVIRARETTNTLSHDYKKYCFSAEYVRKQIISRGQGAVRSNIGQKDLEKVWIAIPPLPEQEKIAGILTTWDRAIDALTQLIEKKKERKKGLMEELLNPRGANPLNENVWRRRRINEIYEFLRTKSHSRNQLEYSTDTSKVKNIHYGDIHASYDQVLLNVKRETRIPVLIDDIPDKDYLTFLQDGDLIVADASEDYDGVADCVELVNVGDSSVISGLHTLALRDFSGLTVKGVRGYLLKSSDVKRQFRRIATGSKVYGISKTNFAKVSILLPSIEEQELIAATLSAADTEIINLEALQSHFTIQKKGLMQKLLTGEIRVKNLKAKSKVLAIEKGEKSS